MLVQIALLAQNGCSSHITSGTKFVNGVTMKMVSCRDGVASLDVNQTKAVNQHPENTIEENLIREEKEVDISKDKETLLKRMGHVGEDHEVENEVVVKENELTLNDGRRMLIK
jgi:hypothetical protein